MTIYKHSAHSGHFHKRFENDEVESLVMELRLRLFFFFFEGQNPPPTAAEG